MKTMIEVKKGENENTLNLIRRFSKRMQNSGILNVARENRFKKRQESDLVKKKRALKKERKRKRNEYLWKMGKTTKTRHNKK